MDEFTIKYLKHALFDNGEFELEQSKEFNDIDTSWNDESVLGIRREYEENEGWYWDGENSAEGILWGGCIESVDELLRHNITIPSLSDFENIVLVLESSEEMPSSYYVKSVIRAFGERGILSKIKGLLIGRPKAWSFDYQKIKEQKIEYKKEQRDIILKTAREYNKDIQLYRIWILDILHHRYAYPW